MAHVKESKYSWTLFKVVYLSLLAVHVVLALPTSHSDSSEENSVHYDRSSGMTLEMKRILEKISPKIKKSEIVDLNCSLSKDIVDEIASYQDFANDVAQLVFNGPLKGKTYDLLAKFVDKFGSRIAGSQNLENSIDYMVNHLTQLGLENVHAEDANVPVWVRGNESLYMLQPRYKQLSLLGLGSSIGTPPEGITAEVIVFNDFEELFQRVDEIPGKIVAYNEEYISYGHAVEYRDYGAVLAGKYGGVGALVRSATPFSIYSPHTGWQDYDNSISSVRVPVASITVEDAEMFRRMQDQGVTITVKLYMEAQNYPDAVSRNTVAELVGATLPDEVVIVSGHMDSWDVGQGAMDDGGGVFISLMAPYAVKYMNLRPRRTLRAVLWTSEEAGYQGAVGYSVAHRNELDNFNIVLESDDGTFMPQGLSVTASNDAACMLKEVMKLTSFLNATALDMPNDGSDTHVFESLGVPVGSLMVNSDKYFDFHHSDGDTMTVEDPNELDTCLVFWTVTSYVLADLSVRLPRDNSTVALTQN